MISCYMAVVIYNLPDSLLPLQYYLFNINGNTDPQNLLSIRRK